MQLAQRQNGDPDKPGKPNRRNKDTDAASDSSSDSDRSNVEAQREPGEFINMVYEDMVSWLDRYLRDKKDAAWMKEWRTVWSRVVPLHTFLRCRP
jgi:hypothetical protein